MNEVTLLKVKTHWSTLKEFDCISQTQNCKINALQEKTWCLYIKETILTTLSNRYIFKIHLVYFSFYFDIFFMNTHRCLFNWVTHNNVVRFCEFLLGVIASYTAKDKFSINTLFLNYTIQPYQSIFFHYPSILVCKRMCKNLDYCRTLHLRHSYESW